MSKSPKVYIVILTTWLVVLGLATFPIVDQVKLAYKFNLTIGILVNLSAVFIAYFWLNGVKDLVYTGYYHIVLRKKANLIPTRSSNSNPHVLLLYTTYNDFEPQALLKSMQQNYKNYEVVILDDSTDPSYMQQIDHFAAKYGIGIVRREDRIGFKAGNLNNYLRRANWDFFVLLDSDEIIPSNFITRSLDYFEHYTNVGIVQANHIATRNRNKFMDTFSIGVDSHWPAYQSVKHQYGFLSLLGHGAMVSRKCYQSAGGFPHVVAEDLCFSIAARNVGYLTAFAPDITCEEEYPVSYAAFRKRHSKWTQGNMEFIKRYTGTILRSRMAWFEKLDIVLFTYSLPLTALFSLYVLIHVVALPVAGYTVTYPAWMLIPTLAFLIAPMLNDVIFHATATSPKKLTSYLVLSMLLYGSMLWVSLRSSIKSAFGKAVFLVTPKVGVPLDWKQTFKLSIGEILFGVALITVSITTTKSVLPVVLIALPALCVPILLRRHNEPYKGRHAAELVKSQ